MARKTDQNELNEIVAALQQVTTALNGAADQLQELAKTTLAASFGATLEMARDGLVELQQSAPFAPIYIRRRDTSAPFPAEPTGEPT